MRNKPQRVISYLTLSQEYEKRKYVFFICVSNKLSVL
jgi:hypothetical protein